MRKIVVAVVCLALFAACGSRQTDDKQAEQQENTRAKQLLQGIWKDVEDMEVAFRVEGDTIFYPDTTSMPTYFKIVGDSLVLGENRYKIEKQSAHLFWFHNQVGDIVKLEKSDEPTDTVVFVNEKPKALIVTKLTKKDTVVFWEGERYHNYIDINPTTYKVYVQSYNDDGVAVNNVYYDNTIHIGVYHGKTKLFGRDFRKKEFTDLVPADFLKSSVLSNMEYVGTDAEGFHFAATICIPDGASCYLVRITVGHDGKVSQKLEEY